MLGVRWHARPAGSSMSTPRGLSEHSALQISAPSPRAPAQPRKLSQLAAGTTDPGRAARRGKGQDPSERLARQDPTAQRSRSPAGVATPKQRRKAQRAAKRAESARQRSDGRAWTRVVTDNTSRAAQQYSTLREWRMAACLPLRSNEDRLTRSGALARELKLGCRPPRTAYDVGRDINYDADARPATPPACNREGSAMEHACCMCALPRPACNADSSRKLTLAFAHAHAHLRTHKHTLCCRR
jgi:hypothetical protein